MKDDSFIYRGEIVLEIFRESSYSVLCANNYMYLVKMNYLVLFTFLTTASCVFAAPGGLHGGTFLSGPSGIVTDHGPIGPAALGLGSPAFGGHSGGPGAYLAGPAGPSAYVSGPALSHASVVGPAAGLVLGGGGFGGAAPFGGYGSSFGGYAGYGGYEGYGHGLGLAPGLTVTNGGGTIGLGSHGVTVKGPPTVPATIAGPSGKVVADGLYGVPTHGHGW